MTQECVSETERECGSLVLIISCSSLLFCDCGSPGRLQFFCKQKAGDLGRCLYLTSGEGTTRFWSVSIEYIGFEIYTIDTVYK